MLRTASAIHGEGHDAAFSLGDFRFALLCAGVLVIVSIWGNAGLAGDAGRRIGQHAEGVAR